MAREKTSPSLEAAGLQTADSPKNSLEDGSGKRQVSLVRRRGFSGMSGRVIRGSKCDAKGLRLRTIRKAEEM